MRTFSRGALCFGLIVRIDREICEIVFPRCQYLGLSPEIYFDEKAPPLGALQAAQQLGRAGYPRLVMFSSLSKRSNVPGMRSGFVAGDAEILKKFLLYRTYQGCAMSPPIHAASTAAWQDEA